jgi:hypothetical protein
VKAPRVPVPMTPQRSVAPPPEGAGASEKNPNDAGAAASAVAAAVPQRMNVRLESWFVVTPCPPAPGEVGAGRGPL